MVQSGSKPRLIVVTYILPVEVKELRESCSHGDRGCMLAHSGQSCPARMDRLQTVQEHHVSETGYFCRVLVDEMYLAIYSLAEQYDVHWVGWPRFRYLSGEDRGRFCESLDACSDLHMVPVFITDEEINSHTKGFCHQFIWTHFHNIADTETPALNESSLIEMYEAVSKKFADRIVEQMTDGQSDLIWIMGHELMLTPSIIRQQQQAKSMSAIGFFLPIPFPLEHFFYTMPNREQLMNGMLGADLIGFQTYVFCRSFLSCVYSLKGIKCKLQRMVIDGRVIIVNQFPVGINFSFFFDDPKLDKSIHSSSVVTHHLDDQVVARVNVPVASLILSNRRSVLAEITPVIISEQAATKGHEPLTTISEIMEKLAEKNISIILSSDRLVQFSEINLRLEAFRLFYEQNPQYHEKLVLLLLVQPPLFPCAKTEIEKMKIEQMVANINGSLQTLISRPVHYAYGNVDMWEMRKLMAMCNVCLATPLVSGMGLLAKEYVTVRSRIGTGVLILSENTGAQEELKQSMIVNPYNPKAIFSAIKNALEMPREIQHMKLMAMKTRLQRNDIYRWARTFLETLRTSYKLSNSLRTRQLTDVDRATIQQAYRLAQGERLMIFDYDRTLVTESEEETNECRNEVIELLKPFIADSRNTVVVKTGKEKDDSEALFGALKVDIIAQDGVWLKQDGVWVENIVVPDDWKKEVDKWLGIFNPITGIRIVEGKHAVSINVDSENSITPERVKRHIRSCSNTLRLVLRQSSVRMVEFQDRIEFKSNRASQSRAVLHWIKAMKGPESRWSYILALSDGNSDDDDLIGQFPIQSHTIKVGKTPTDASFYISNPAGARLLMRGFV